MHHVPTPFGPPNIIANRRCFVFQMFQRLLVSARRTAEPIEVSPESHVVGETRETRNTTPTSRTRSPRAT